MKYWLSSTVEKQSQHEKVQIVKNKNPPKKVPINKESTVKYLPKNAHKISVEQHVEWQIKNNKFLVYYKTGEELLEAFREEVEKRKGKRKFAAYKQHMIYIWSIVDPTMEVVPVNALGNCLLVEDKYHDPTYAMLGKGGNQASTLRVHFVAFRAFIKFLNRRKVYGGMTRENLRTLSECIDEWNSDFTDHIAQRKTDVRRIKLQRLMTPAHMIKYGRSSYVRSIVENISKGMKHIKLTIMNGLRSSNIIELRVADVEEAEKSEEYPGYMVFRNSLYKTSTIYGEKVIVLPDNIFKHLKFYIKYVRPLLNFDSNTYLFISTDAEQMSHGAIGSALTSSFKNADVFTKAEYTRVCPTRIRCACATFGCKKEGVDSGHFAKYFMKNKEDTTNIHYNLYSNHREALKLAMVMGDTFGVGGVTRIVKKKNWMS